MQQNKIFTLLFLLFGILTASFAQKKTVSGTVKDKLAGETLIGATISIDELPTEATITNEYGFYSLTVKEGKYTLRVSYVGFQSSVQKVDLTVNQKVDIGLENGETIQEVVISDKKKDENVARAQMGVEKLDMKEIAKLPVLFGERDVLKTIQLLPGVKSAGEGSSGFFVRGGALDQNLILLDEAPVYNASHLLGFFSTFNSDAIKDATLLKGLSPAQYGGRLSSVLDIKMNEGNDKTYHASGGIGLISSKLNVEGPIQKEKSSFLISARRTYLDVFFPLIGKIARDTNITKSLLYFYDINAKANIWLGEKDRLFVSGYFGRDLLGIQNAFGLDYGNQTGTLRWNHVINPQLFSNTSLIYSDYSYNINVTANNINFNINSKIKDWNFKEEFQFFPNSKNNWRFGANAIYHTIKPSRFEGTNLTGPTRYDQHGLETAVYANNEWAAAPKLNINYGLRASAYSLMGDSKYYTYTTDYAPSKTSDSLILSDAQVGKTYFNLEPRLTFSYRLDSVSSLKGGYSRQTQPLHLLSNSTGGTPTDQWIGSSLMTKPEIADQLSLGYFRNFDNNKFEFSAEVYYKLMQNQVDYKNGANLFTTGDVETQLLYGDGRAYGLELFLKKKTGKLTGWISYTLSRSERLIKDIAPDWYPARQDRTHDLSVVASYQITPKWSVSGVFIYYTGNAVTLPHGFYIVGNKVLPYYPSRNADRFPDYQRLDLSATYETKRKGKYQDSWNFSVYNAYAYKNAFSISTQESKTNPGTYEFVQTTLFTIVPSVTYNFKF
jgi:hypothetical protein